MATNWLIPPDPVLEPVTEIVSVHGSSEAPDSPQPIYDPVAGNFVREAALGRGYRFGFIGSGDSHDGHPGFAQLASPVGGLAAILSEERTREGVLAALRARRVYATSGPRILLRFALGAHPMGSSVTLAPGESLSESLFVSVLAPGPLERVDLIRSGRVVDTIAARGRARGDARTPGRGAAARRVRLRARGAARQRRGVVEPDLRRVSREPARAQLGAPRSVGPAQAAPRISVLLPVWNAAATLAGVPREPAAPDRNELGMRAGRRWLERREPRDRARLRGPRCALRSARPPAPRASSPRSTPGSRAAAAASSRAWTPTT